jgi:hypothetical protein
VIPGGLAGIAAGISTNTGICGAAAAGVHRGSRRARASFAGIVEFDAMTAGRVAGFIKF